MKQGLVYSKYGKGEAIVFLHGFLGDRSIWKDYVKEFENEYQVITVDLPGHGESSINKEIMLMSDIASMIDDILISENIKQAHFVGHSMGGYVSLAYAKQNPGKVLSLTLFNSTAKGDSEQKKSDRLRAVRVFDLNPNIFIKEAIANLFYDQNLIPLSKEVEELTNVAYQTSVEGAQACLRGMREREDLVGWLQEQTFPVHYIAGKHDGTVLYSTILEQLPERAKLTTLEQGGHMGFAEEPEKCLGALKEFVLSCKHG